VTVDRHDCTKQPAHALSKPSIQCSNVCHVGNGFLFVSQEDRFKTSVNTLKPTCNTCFLHVTVSARWHSLPAVGQSSCVMTDAELISMQLLSLRIGVATQFD